MYRIKQDETSEKEKRTRKPKKPGQLSTEDYKRIKPISTTIPTLYGLPKIHKQNNPMRPILCSTGSYNHQCATWLTEILTPLRHHQTILKDTFEFLDKIKHVSIKDKIMASFDVKSLFTNILLQFTIKLILDQIFSNGVTLFHGLNKSQFHKLLIWASTGTTF